MTHITPCDTDRFSADGLSPTATVMWAKSRNADGDWLRLIRHMADAAEMADQLWSSFLPAAIRRQVTRGTEDDPHLARKLVLFTTASHDIGKATPMFSSMPGVGLDEEIRAKGLRFGQYSSHERRESPHSALSHIALTDWLQRRHGWSRSEATFVAAIPGGHHGRFPRPEAVQHRGIHTMGDVEWRAVQDELAEYAARVAGMSDANFATLRNVRLAQPAAILCTAVVIVSDWLASTEQLFPFRDQRRSDERARAAFERLCLPAPWSPCPPISDTELFISRCDLTSPRPMQTRLVQLARTIAEPEMIIVEAPTGEGKTKAALAAAEILAYRFGLGGLIFALPTRATSDAIFTEVSRWVTATLESDNVTLALVHATAEFNSDYENLVARRRVYDDEQSGRHGSAVANWYLAGRGKLSTLSSVVVSTIDQVLIAGLAAKHVVLRHLGLAGKVVILDEIHAADSYMAEYLKIVLTWLGRYEVPVIALSATLPPDRRAELLAAYNKGRGRTNAPCRSHGYPVISHSSAAGSESHPVLPSGRSSSVGIAEFDGNPAEIADMVLARVADGGRIAIVCNTVTRAQSVARRLLSTDTDASIILMHSRFLGTDRRRRESVLRDLLGPAPSVARRAEDKLIVVATQVIEQSLDLDFDLMASDLAPVDLLIQRAGRLHRHRRADGSRPASMRSPRLILTGFRRRVAAAPELDRGSDAVYGAAPLLRALTVLDRLRESSGVFRSPADVEQLVVDAYDPDLTAPPGWEQAWTEAEYARDRRRRDQIQRARDFTVDPPRPRSLIKWPEALARDPDSVKGLAQVRDADDAIEVVVVQRHANGHVVAPQWDTAIAGQQVDLGAVIEDGLARRLAQNTVRLPSYLGRGRTGDELIDALEREYFPATWQQSRWLRGMLALVLDSDGCATLADHHFEYDDALGLIVDYREEDR